MKLSIKAFVLTSALFWAGSLLLIGVINRFCPPYGLGFLQIMDGLYPGYRAGAGLINVGVGTLYAVVDGAACGALFAWIYNRFAA
ncbi:MAG: hypothetical protein A3G41_00675 [Elusimicrobia bacterium RIFCSPLOWO2_12_FULL_59_9]|nr:MAG: hypothetical protein A3G41_00675 [Elusimicrobia bacterium RIFCSPLOWO2_12_FULL_59_9]